MSRATYFRLKRAGRLPAAGETETRPLPFYRRELTIEESLGAAPVESQAPAARGRPSVGRLALCAASRRPSTSRDETREPPLLLGDVLEPANAASGPHRRATEHGIDVVVAKNSGGTATYGKIAAARALRLPVIIVRRPVLPAVPAVEIVDDAVAWLDHAFTS